MKTEDCRCIQVMMIFMAMTNEVLHARAAILMRIVPKLYSSKPSLKHISSAAAARLQWPGIAGDAARYVI